MSARSESIARRSRRIARTMAESARLRPNEPDAYVELGNLLIVLGRETEGIAQVRAALDCDPAYPLALAELAFYTIANGDESAARPALARVVAQPRIPAEQVTTLMENYRRRFGHEWHR